MNPAEEYILNQKEPYHSILLSLSHLLELTLKDYFELKFSFQIPFYYYKDQTFCYLIKPKKKDYVDLTFIKGKKLESPLLISDGRKMVKSLRFKSENEIDGKLITEIISKAMSFY